MRTSSHHQPEAQHPKSPAIYTPAGRLPHLWVLCHEYRRSTRGQAHDLACAEPLIDNADPNALLADKAYDADPFIGTLTQRGITPVIPPKANRKTPRACDFALYRERNLVERFFNQLKHFRAIATRYDKLARNFLAGVQLAAAMILLN